jgi:DNA-binding PadR family transcriptional regulator
MSNPDSENTVTSTASATDAFLPLAPVDLQLLIVASRGPVHGYAMMKAVEEQSAGRLRIELGSLYRILQRLERDGLVEIVKAPIEEAPSPGRERRYYGITALGRGVVAAELKRLQSVIDLARGEHLRPGEAG